MNKLKLFLGITIILVTAGCNRNYTHYVNSYILEYMKIKDARLVKTSLSDPTIELQFYIFSRVSFLSEGEDKHVYDSLCALYGDLGYDRKIHLILNIINVSSYYPEILSIDFVSDADFDEAHPAGTSLKDCMQITYTSAYEYVSSGYTSEKPREQTKLLSEIESQDLLLLLSLPSKTFSFIKTPEIEMKHTLTAKIELSDSTIIETSIDYRFSLDES